MCYSECFKSVINNIKKQECYDWQLSAYNKFIVNLNKDIFTIHACTSAGKTKVINLLHGKVCHNIKHNNNFATGFIAPQLNLIEQNAVSYLKYIIDYNIDNMHNLYSNDDADYKPINLCIINISSDDKFLKTISYEDTTIYNICLKNKIEIISSTDAVEINDKIKNMQNTYFFICSTFISFKIIEKIQNIGDIELITYDEYHSELDMDYDFKKLSKKSVFISATPELKYDAEIDSYRRKVNLITKRIEDEKVKMCGNAKKDEKNKVKIEYYKKEINDYENIINNLDLEQSLNNKDIIELANYTYKQALEDKIVSPIKSINFFDNDHKDTNIKDNDSNNISKAICYTYFDHLNDQSIKVGKKMLVKFNSIATTADCINKTRDIKFMYNEEEKEYKNFIEYLFDNNIKFIRFASESNNIKDEHFDENMKGFLTNISNDGITLRKDDFTKINGKEAKKLLNSLSEEDNAIIFHIEMLTCGIDVPLLTAFLPVCNMEIKTFKQNIGRIVRKLPSEIKKDPDRKLYSSIYICENFEFIDELKKFIKILETEEYITITTRKDIIISNCVISLEPTNYNEDISKNANYIKDEDLKNEFYKKIESCNCKIDIIETINYFIKNYNSRFINMNYYLKDEIIKNMYSYMSENDVDIVSCHYTPNNIIKEMVDMLTINSETKIMCTNLEFINYILKNNIHVIKNNIIFSSIHNSFIFNKLCELLFDITNLNTQDFLEEEMPEVDIVIGNPPYQKMDKHEGQGASPIYQNFINVSYKISNEVIMIIPAKWMWGGKGLDNFRSCIINNSIKAKYIKYYSQDIKIFDNNDIGGGVCILHLDKKYNKNLSFENVFNKEIFNYNLKYTEQFVKSKIQNDILNKISNKYTSFENIIHSMNTFKVKSYYTDTNDINCINTRIKMLGVKQELYSCEHYKIITGIEKWKLSYVYVDHGYDHYTNNNKYIGYQETYILPPNVITNNTIPIFKFCETKEDCENLQMYLRTKTSRYLIGINSITHHFSKKCFRFLPDIGNYELKYTDEMLYKLFGFNQDEINEIENTIDDMNSYTNNKCNETYYQKQERKQNKIDEQLKKDISELPEHVIK